MWKPKHKGAADRKAFKVLNFIASWTRTHPYPPTYKTIATAFGKSETWVSNYHPNNYGLQRRK